MTRILSVEFETTSQNWREGQFSIPSDVANLLSLSNEKKIVLDITSSKGTKSFITEIKSGLEIYPLQQFVGKNELIRVRVSSAPEFL
ncbi:hypothetical protein BCT63_01695 [Vibrio kanaloae]|uniref:hypothetical protein n=1 Tax=Vibrio kanaloae TaxID=170673 RepID=UPI000C8601EE|nr:hypothetical protein [Vibrio kanaloae]PMM04197.1 hypothetical protein BCT63_01695 [Vibrio kanaloae]